MANETTTVIGDIINPEVMADMISAKITEKIVVAPFAKIDDTLAGKPGDTITVPQYAYIGDASDVSEGIAAATVKLTADTVSAKVKKAMKAVELTDEAVLSGYGNPVGEANTQIAKAIAAKVDNDAIAALGTAQLAFDGSAGIISYANIVDAVGVFNEEVNTEKVMFIHPAQVTQLRKDPDFISADKYAQNVVMLGEIGMIANCRIVASKKVSAFSTWYYFVDDEAVGALEIVESGATAGEVNLSAVTPTLPNAEVGDFVMLSSIPVYVNPIIKLTQDEETEDEAAALTIYLKRDTNVETDRVSLARKTNVSADKFYTVALSNTSKVVLAKIAQAPAVVVPVVETPLSDVYVTSAAGAATNGSVITIDPASAGTGHKYAYKLGTAFAEFEYGDDMASWTDLASGDDIACGSSTKITIAKVTTAGLARGRGVAVLTKKA